MDVKIYNMSNKIGTLQVRSKKTIGLIKNKNLHHPNKIIDFLNRFIMLDT